jgi:hypothetical protein
MTLDRNRVMLIVAAGVTVLAWGCKLWPAGSGPTRPVPAASAAAVQPSVAAVALTPPPPPLSSAAVKTWVGLHQSARDPFFTVAEIDARNRPPVASHPTVPVSTVPLPPPLPVYTLKLVMTVGSERLASIDDRVVRVGDMMGSERVVQILSDAVVLEHGGERRRLLLSTSESSLGLIHIERVR